VIDLSKMRGVRVDPVTRTARVTAGCVTGDVDRATRAFGSAAPFGVISTTGGSSAERLEPRAKPHPAIS